MPQEEPCRATACARTPSPSDLTTAVAAYERLLRIAAEAIEQGWTIAPEPADDDTLQEAACRFLRGLYDVTAPEDRPGRLRQAVTGLQAVIVPGNLSLAGVAGAAPQPPPDLEAFLGDWVTALRPLADDSGANGAWAHAVLLEGVARLEGPRGLAALARSAGHRSGEAYLAWVDAARHAGDLDGAAEAAREGLGALAPGWQRAAIAERLATLADNAGDKKAALEAWLEAWRSAPSLDRLLALMHLTRRAGAAAEIVNTLAADARVQDAAPAVRVALLVLTGDLDSAVAMPEANRRAPVARQDRDEADAVVVPALLIAGADATRDRRFPGTVLAGLLESADDVVARADRFSFSDDADRPPLPAHDLTLGGLLIEALDGLTLDAHRRRSLLDAGSTAAADAVARIVEAKARRRYTAAARYAIAHADAVALAHGHAAGDGVADDAHARYPRHTAYRSELATTRARSPLLSPPPRRR